MLVDESKRCLNASRMSEVDDDCTNLAEVAAKHGCTGALQKGRPSDLVKLSQDLHANQVKLTEAGGGGSRGRLQCKSDAEWLVGGQVAGPRVAGEHP